jgi:hypothetical protein
MTITTLEFAPQDKRETLEARVYLRENWAAPWVLEPYLWPLRVNWTTNQSIDTAELGTWRYGRGIRNDAAVWALIQRLTGKPRWYVKIEIDTHTVNEDTSSGSGSGSAPLTWYGWIEVDADQLQGVREDPNAVTFESGQQTFTAYGLESVLLQQRMYHHAWRPDVGGGYNLTDTAPDFNADGHGNREDSKSLNSYLFSARVHDDHETWSTRDIVEYMLYEGVPKNKNDVQMVPFSLEDPDGLLPDTDAPVVTQEGRRSLEVINELCSPSRLLGYRLEVEAGTDTVLLRPFTYTSTDIVSLERTVPENPTQLILQFERAPDVQASLQTTSLAAVDQVIARGARRRSVCSLSITDGNLVEAWDADLQTEYDQGASNNPDYPAAGEIDDRQRQDAEVRTLDRFRNVYSRLEIVHDWDGLAGDGFSGAADAPVFPVEAEAGSGSGSGSGDVTPYLFNPRLLEILPNLALLDGYEYDDPQTPGVFDNGPWVELPPAAFAPLPESEGGNGSAGSSSGSGGGRRWVDLAQNAAAAHVENTQDEQARTWSVGLTIPANDRAVELRVRGAPQHALAYETFVPLAHEQELQWGQYDYHETVVLVTLLDQRWIEERFPSDESLPGTLDVIRRHFLDLGDGYRLDYVVPDTFVAIDEVTGEPVISEGGYIRDDRDKLFSIAFAAYTYLSVERKALTIRMHRLIGEIRIGDYVLSVGDDFPIPINSVVTSIEIVWPEADGAGAGAAEMTIETGFAEADAIKW